MAPYEADTRYLEAARRLAMYGVDAHPAKVRETCLNLSLTLSYISFSWGSKSFVFDCIYNFVDLAHCVQIVSDVI